MDTTSNHTYQTTIRYRADDVRATTVHAVAHGAVDPLCGHVSLRSHAEPATGNGRPLVILHATYFAANDNEALRTAKVMASAIRPLVAAVTEPTAEDVDRLEGAMV